MQSAFQLLEMYVSKSPHPFLAPALNCSLISPSHVPVGGGLSHLPLSFMQEHVSSSAGEELPSPLWLLFVVPSAISPSTLPSLAPKQDGFVQWFSMTANASLAKKTTHSGHLYSALLLVWFASTLTRGFGFSSEWGRLQLKIRAGWKETRWINRWVKSKKSGFVPPHAWGWFCLPLTRNVPSLAWSLSPLNSSKPKETSQHPKH